MDIGRMADFIAVRMDWRRRRRSRAESDWERDLEFFESGAGRFFIPPWFEWNSSNRRLRIGRNRQSAGTARIAYTVGKQLRWKATIIRKNRENWF